MEDAVLDSDALIRAYDLGVKKFVGVHTTCVSIYEFLRGLAYLGKQLPGYKAFLEAYLDVLPMDNKSIVMAATVYAGLRRKGLLVEDPDLLTACICIANHLPLVTGNADRFERFSEYGLTLKPLNEFMSAVQSE